MEGVLHQILEVQEKGVIAPKSGPLVNFHGLRSRTRKSSYMNICVGIWQAAFSEDGHSRLHVVQMSVTLANVFCFPWKLAELDS